MYTCGRDPWVYFIPPDTNDHIYICIYTHTISPLYAIYKAYLPTSNAGEMSGLPRCMWQSKALVDRHSMAHAVARVQNHLGWRKDWSQIEWDEPTNNHVMPYNTN